VGIAGGSHARTEELILGAREFRWGALVLAVAPLAGCEAPDPPPTAPDPPPAGLSVELIDVTAVTDGPGGRGRFWATVRFRNAGPDPVWVLRPLDGSRDGRLMPHYRLTVTGPPDADDRVRGSCPICGKWFNTEWPRDYLVEVPAGRAAQVRGAVGGRLPGAGRYVLQFEYVYLPGAGGVWPPDDLSPPAQAWRGRASAPAAELDYRPDPGWRPPTDDPLPDPER
jgi:hypothetical protein